MRIKQLVAASLAGISMVATVSAAGPSMGTAPAATPPAWGPQWTNHGELVLPKGFRDWVFLGSPLTPNALNDGEAGFPEYHNVYVRPEPLKIYRETGQWPDGTIMLKELQLLMPGTNADGSRLEASGRGYFPGALNGIDISVKDSRRFKETKDWGFFNFGHHAPPYAETAPLAPVASCAGCHMGNPEGMVFRQFYTHILDAH